MKHLKHTFLVLMFFISCKKQVQSTVVFQKDTIETNTSLCENLKTKGVQKICCKEWSSNNLDKVIVFSKTQSNSGEEFFTEIFTSNNLNNSIVSIYDFIKDCPVDYSINFFKESFSISDLDNNGVKEITFVYEIVCQGGIGPTKMKLVMIEGRNKYIIRGLRLDVVSIKNNINPNYPNSIIDKTFNAAPKTFLEYAKEKWNKNHGTNTVSSYIDKWKGTYNLKLEGLVHMDETHNLSYIFKIKNDPTIITQLDDEEKKKINCKILKGSKDTLFFQEKDMSQKSEYKLFKNQQGDYIIGGHSIYMINPPNKSYPLEKK